MSCEIYYRTYLSTEPIVFEVKTDVVITKCLFVIKDNEGIVISKEITNITNEEGVYKIVVEFSQTESELLEESKGYKMGIFPFVDNEETPREDNLEDNLYMIKIKRSFL